MDVGTRAAGLLGQGEVDIDGLVLELVHQLIFKLLGAVIIENAPVEVGRMMEMHAHSARTAGEFFLHTQNFELGKIPSSVYGRQVVTIQIVLLGEFVELLRERVRDLDFLLHLIERAFGQLANLLQVSLELLIGDFRVGIHTSSFWSRDFFLELE